MERIITDTYTKGEKYIFMNDPTIEFNKKIVAVNNMYGWLYEQGILEKTAFVYKDYTDTTYFAVDAKNLEPYREEMEESKVDGAALAVSHIFDVYYTPCHYSGAIELGWMMQTYRDVDGCVGGSWECDLIKCLNTEGIYKISDIQREKGTKEAVKALYAEFDWNKEGLIKEFTENSLADKIRDAESVKAEQINKKEPFEKNIDSER